MERALVTGITGQDGYFLSQLLLEKGYELWGLVRSEDPGPRFQPDGDLSGAVPIVGDMSDRQSIVEALRTARPTEVYNLASISSVSYSFSRPHLTADINGMGVVRLLDAVQQECGPETRVFQASSSEMFGNPDEDPQTETTPLRPVSPYGASKAFAHHIASVYRDSYAMYVACGIMYNHESGRRPPQYVTRKIANGAARIALGKASKLVLGNLSVERDWGYAGDYAYAKWCILQHDVADDFVVATGERRRLLDLVRIAFEAAQIDDWQAHVMTDESLYRPNEIPSNRGDPSKIEATLGWEASVSIEQVMEDLVSVEMARESEG